MGGGAQSRNQGDASPTPRCCSRAQAPGGSVDLWSRGGRVSRELPRERGGARLAVRVSAAVSAVSRIRGGGGGVCDGGVVVRSGSGPPLRFRSDGSSAPDGGGSPLLERAPLSLSARESSKRGRRPRSGLALRPRAQSLATDDRRSRRVPSPNQKLAIARSHIVCCCPAELAGVVVVADAAGGDVARRARSVLVELHTPGRGF